MDFSTSKGFQILISLYQYTLIIIALYLEEVTNSQYLHHVLDINLSTQFTIIRKHILITVHLYYLFEPIAG